MITVVPLGLDLFIYNFEISKRHWKSVLFHNKIKTSMKKMRSEVTNFKNCRW